MSRPPRRTGCAVPARWSTCSSGASPIRRPARSIEFFAADWLQAIGAPGRLREPGHQFEWVWLLCEYYRLSRDESVIPYAQRLFDFGDKFGIERGGGSYRRRVRWRRCHRRTRCRHKTVLAADRIHQGAGGARRMAERRGRTRRDLRHLALIAKSFLRAGRRELAQSARARRQAARADDACARAVSSVHGGGGSGSDAVALTHGPGRKAAGPPSPREVRDACRTAPHSTMRFEFFGAARHNPADAFW